MPAAAKGDGLAGAYFLIGDVGDEADEEDDAEGVGREREDDLWLREGRSCVELVAEFGKGAASGVEEWVESTGLCWSLSCDA
jgi:hypothetical protein